MPSILQSLGGTKSTSPPPRDPTQRLQGLAQLVQFRAEPVAGWTDNRLLQSQKYTGTAFLALSAVQEAMASAIVTCEAQKPQRGRSTFGPGSTFAKAALPGGGAGNDEDYAPVHNHPLADIIHRPNSNESFGAMLGYMSLQWGLTGNAPLWLVPGEGHGKPVELYPLVEALLAPALGQSALYPEGAWQVQPYYASGFNWSGYGTLGQRMASSTILPGTEVRKLRAPHPLTRTDGYSALTACGIQIDIMEAIDQSRHSAFMQGAQLGTIVYVPGLDEAQNTAASESFKQRYGGPRNARKVAVVSSPPGAQGEFKIEQLGESVREMDYANSWEQATNFVLATFGAHSAVVGLKGATGYAEFYAAQVQTWVRLSQLCKRFADFFTHHLAGPWSKRPGQFRIKIELPKPRNDETRGAQTVQLGQMGALPLNTMLQALDFAPVRYGELPLALYLKKLEAETFPQPAVPPGQPGQPAPGDATGGLTPSPADAGAEQGAEQQPDAAGTDAGEQPQEQADPLAALLGGDTGEGEQQDAEGDDSEQGTQDAVGNAALAALGLSSDDEGDTVGKAVPTPKITPTKPGANKRREGETWQVNGNWYTKKNGLTVHTKAPGAGAEAGAKAPNHPDNFAGRGAKTVAPADHDAVAKKFLAGRDSVRLLGPDHKTGHTITDGASLKAFLDKGGKLPPATPDSEPTTAPKLPPPLPADYIAAAKSSSPQPPPLPPAHVAAAAATLPPPTPASAKTLASAKTWSHAQADKHADRVARHFRITPEKAHALLVSAIESVAAHAAKSGTKPSGFTLRDKRTGKTASLAPKGKGDTPTGGAPPRPVNPAGAGSLPPRGSVGKAVPAAGGGSGGTDAAPAGDGSATPASPAKPTGKNPRVKREEGAVWQVNQNWYTKKNGKIVKTGDPSKRRTGSTKKDEKQQAKQTKEEHVAKVATAAEKLAAGGDGMTHDDVKFLDDHLATLTGDKLKEVARAIGAKLSGPKKELAARLVEHAKKLASGEKVQGAKPIAAPTPAPTEQPAPAAPAAPPPAQTRAALDALGIDHSGQSDDEVVSKLRAAFAPTTKPAAPTSAPAPASPAPAAKDEPAAKGKASVPAGHEVAGEVAGGAVVAKDPMTGSLTTHFATGEPEKQAKKLGSAITSGMKELKADVEFQDGIIPLGAIAQEVRNVHPGATDADILAAMSHMQKTRQVEGQPLNETQKLTQSKSDVAPLGGGKNPATATLWDNGKAVHYFMLPKGAGAAPSPAPPAKEKPAAKGMASVDEAEKGEPHPLGTLISKFHELSQEGKGGIVKPAQVKELRAELGKVPRATLIAAAKEAGVTVRANDSHADITAKLVAQTHGLHEGLSGGSEGFEDTKTVHRPEADELIRGVAEAGRAPVTKVAPKPKTAPKPAPVAKPAKEKTVTPKANPRVDAAEKSLDADLDKSRSDPSIVGDPEAAKSHADSVIANLKANHTPEEIHELAKRVTGKAGRKGDGSDSLELIHKDLMAVSRIRETQRV